VNTDNHTRTGQGGWHTSAATSSAASVPSAAEVLSAATRPHQAAGSAGSRRLGQRRILVGLLAIADLSVCVIAFRLAQWTYRSAWMPLWLHPSPTPSVVPNLLLWIAVVFMTLKWRGLYRFRYGGGLYGVSRTATSVVLAGAIFIVMRFFLDLSTYRSFVALMVSYTLVLLAGSRYLFRQMAAHLPPLCRRVLVVGGEDSGQSTARMIAQYRSRGVYLVSGGADGGAHVRRSPSSLDTNDLDRVATYIRKLDVDDVVITREWYVHNCPDVEHAFMMLNRLPAQVHVAPDPAELMMRMAVEDFSGLPLVSLSTLSLSRWQLGIKRVFDVVVSGVLIVVTSPLLLVIALAIRATSHGPAIFKQVRIGQHHRLFVVYKFRTMYTGDHAIPTDGAPHKRRHDDRVTPVGRWLRRMSLDELPQFFNVFKGEMSLVGPRPELPEIAARYEPWQYGRLLVPQGMTGWWQVNGRGERILHEHTEDDIYYVRNFSLMLDAKIILMTLRAIITGRGAF
jgi:exopolysaccharide biosynthesis polyprenyl glycosylphosphotransferase